MLEQTVPGVASTKRINILLNDDPTMTIASPLNSEDFLVDRLSIYPDQA
jgi:hypothetical protein